LGFVVKIEIGLSEMVLFRDTQACNMSMNSHPSCSSGRLTGLVSASCAASGIVPSLIRVCGGEQIVDSSLSLSHITGEDGGCEFIVVDSEVRVSVCSVESNFTSSATTSI